MSAKDTHSRGVEAFNRNDAAAFAALYAADAVVRDPQYPQPLRGRAAIEQDVVDVHRVLPDASSHFARFNDQRPGRDRRGAALLRRDGNAGVVGLT